MFVFTKMANSDALKCGNIVSLSSVCNGPRPLPPCVRRLSARGEYPYGRFGGSGPSNIGLLTKSAADVFIEHERASLRPKSLIDVRSAKSPAMVLRTKITSYCNSVHFR